MYVMEKNGEKEDKQLKFSYKIVPIETFPTKSKKYKTLNLFCCMLRVHKVDKVTFDKAVAVLC